jgi:hypothetical protein
MAVGGGNFLYIGAYLKNIAELESLARFVKEKAEMPEPTVGIRFSSIPPFLKKLKTDSKLCDGTQTLQAYLKKWGTVTGETLNKSKSCCQKQAVNEKENGAFLPSYFFS